jgi:hypothetical protein
MTHVDILFKRLVDFSEPGHPTYNRNVAVWWSRLLELSDEEMSEFCGSLVSTLRIRQWMDAHNGAEPTIDDIYGPEQTITND